MNGSFFEMCLEKVDITVHWSTEKKKLVTVHANKTPHLQLESAPIDRVKIEGYVERASESKIESYKPANATSPRKMFRLER